MSDNYSLGIDFGTNSVRCLVVRVSDGAEIGTAVAHYEHGEAGILLDAADPNLARQHPRDYETGMESAVQGALEDASKHADFSPDKVIGIGVDGTGSTPIPLDADGLPVAYQKKFADNVNAMAWLWKDHTSYEEAAAITARAAETHPEYIAKCGGVYSSEWFFSKIWHCLNVDPQVFDAADTWAELSDWIPAVLTGTTAGDQMKRNVCAAGHKAMFHPDWGGLPSREFLESLDPKLGALRIGLFGRTHTVDEAAGGLSYEWADRLGLPPEIPVAVGALDAHMGAIGAGIGPGAMVKILGTSSCDMAVTSSDRELPDVPGLCGIVLGSILPGHYGLEAGQAACGDIYNWWVNEMQAGGPEQGSHESLTAEAEQLKPGQSGLLALDWNNGNRTILVDPRLTGLLLGQTLHTTPGEIYRTLIEATAFGARVILERFGEYGIEATSIINAGGIAEKNPFVMQIYADITGRPMRVSRSAQTCALGAAMCGAVVAGKNRGGYATLEDAQAAMAGLKDIEFRPIPQHQAIYDRLYQLYRQVHDTFGTRDGGNLFNVMKDLLSIRDEARGN